MEYYNKYVRRSGYDKQPSHYITTNNTNVVIPDHIQNIIKKLLPETELCNEIFLHNKVFKGNYDICRLIPSGRKCLLWFKMNKGRPSAYIIYVDPRKKQLQEVENANITFSKYLTNNIGTLLYGTLTKQNEKSFFVMEDIKYFKGKNLQKTELLNKLEEFNELFSYYIGVVDNFNYNPENKKTLNNKTLNKKTTNRLVCSITQMFSMETYNEEVISNINNYYQIFSIQYIKSNKIYVKRYNNKKRTQQFIIKPKVQNDIYDVYKKNQVTGNIEYIDIAFIPDYKTSVMMNNYYRNIKENKCLDYLEESDDEEEFENISETKYVYMDRECLFECSFNKKFKKWVPIRYIEDYVMDS